MPTPGTGLLVFNRNAAISGGVGFYDNAGPAAAPSRTKRNPGAASAGSGWGLNLTSRQVAGASQLPLSHLVH